ncbi:MAG: hypothetical protein IK096_04475, partial [Lachnospiraceae bacterium]|nr:hypothetical protein [Lachnospiraceae bacterium]
MRTRNGKRAELKRKAALCAAGLFLAASLSVFLMSTVHAADETDPDHFLDGLSESERSQFLEEVYSDMESDTVSAESTPFTQALEEELGQSGGSASEEEAV